MKCSNNNIQIEINELVIIGKSQQNNQSYEFFINFNDGNTINISGSQVRVTEMLS